MTTRSRANRGPTVLLAPDEDAVFREVVGVKQSDTAANALSGASWIERAAPCAVPTSVVEWDLGPGESAVIATALATPGAHAVIDDLSARKCALALGLGVMGTWER